MTLLFMDGFDHYSSLDILKKWTQTAYTPVRDAISPDYALVPGGAGFKSPNYALNKAFPSTYAVGIVGFWINFNAAIASSVLAGFSEGAYAEQCSIRTDSSGHLIVSRNGTTLATSTNTFSTSTWYHIEFKCTIHSSAGTYEVRVNGSSTNWIPAATGKNTRAQTNNTFAQGFIFGGTGAYFDDVYFLNCDAAPNNDFLGPQKIITCFPKAVGAYSDWTANAYTNFENVKDTMADALTFNQTASNNLLDTFKVDNVPAGTIAAIQHVISARQDAGTGKTFCPIERASGTDVVGTTQALTASNLFYMDPKDTDPGVAPAAAFTTANFNAEEFGYKSLS